MPSSQQLDAVIALIDEVCGRNGIDDAYFVGGFPRAIAMGTGWADVKDLDIATATPGQAVKLAGLVAEAGNASHYRRLSRTGTVTIEVSGVEMDFQGSMYDDEVLPFLHAAGVDADPIALNIFSRDFTINALAIKVGGDEIEDVTSRAMDDISDRRIASILPADFSVKRNPLMITRATKFAYKYNYKIDGHLWNAMKNNAGELERQLSPERLAVEAFVLSKYDCGEMLGELGIDFMSDPAVIEEGQEIVG